MQGIQPRASIVAVQGLGFRALTLNPKPYLNPQKKLAVDAAWGGRAPGLVGFGRAGPKLSVKMTILR